MEKSQILSQDKAKLIHREISEFFKKENINIALENALDQKPSKDFRNRVHATLTKQISPFTQEDTIKSIVLKIGKSSSSQSKTTLAVAAAFVIFSQAFSQGEQGIFLYLVWAAAIGGTDALEKMNANNTTFSPLLSEESKRLILNRVQFLVTQVDQTTIQWVAGIIDSGFNKGLSPKQIADAIKEQQIEVINYRSDVIAETELAAMIGQFNLETFRNNRIKRVRWITSRDERTCPICFTNEDYGWIEIGTNFPSGNPHPPAHIGCRCYIEPDGEVSGTVWRG